MKYKIITALFFIFLMVNYGQAAVPYFGEDGLQGLSESQRKDISEGKIIFFASDSVYGETTQAKSSIVTAVMLLDKSPEETYSMLFHTEDQIKYLEEIKEIKIVRKGEAQDDIEFKLKVIMFTFVYRVIHNFDKKNMYINWAMDKSFNNDLSDLQGFWKLYSYPGGKTLARYGSNVSVKNVPDWIENMFKKKGVEKSLNCVKKYVNTGWTLKR